MIERPDLDENEPRRPAAMCAGGGHLIVYGNPAFVTAFGRESIGLPAREALIDLPSAAFSVLDAVYRTGRPLGRWIRFGGEEWRVIAAPRVDICSHEVYGVSFHLRARSDVPSMAAQAPKAAQGSTAVARD